MKSLFLLCPSVCIFMSNPRQMLSACAQLLYVIALCFLLFTTIILRSYLQMYPLLPKKNEHTHTHITTIFFVQTKVTFLYVLCALLVPVFLRLLISAKLKKNLNLYTRSAAPVFWNMLDRSDCDSWLHGFWNMLGLLVQINVIGVYIIIP